MTNLELATPPTKKKFDLLKDRSGIKIQLEGTELTQSLPEKKSCSIKRNPIMVHKETQIDQVNYNNISSPSQNLEKLLERINNDKNSSYMFGKNNTGQTDKNKADAQIELKETLKLEGFNSLLNETDKVQDALRSRIMSEYFSMIEDFILVADHKLSLMLNNFSPQIWKSVIKKIKNRMKFKELQFADCNDGLESLFTKSYVEPIYCGEDTIINMINLYKVFDYSARKVKDIEYFKDKKLDKILLVLEKLEKTTKISLNPNEQNPIVGYIKDIKKVTGSVRGIDFKSKNKIVA